ncbi:MAG: RNA polymerase sigma factor [Actinobacteria bacterium]|nr:RNA polymerase sigma factor [Actinomycetota bacterium]
MAAATDPNTPRDARRAIDAIWRIESARLIAGLARFTGDLGRAEELAQDALVIALEKWPEGGVPDSPGAWLMTTAKNRAIDLARRDATFREKAEQIGRESESDGAAPSAESEASLDGEIGDDLLSLVFTTCHPLLSREAQVALTLRLLGGLTTGEIARAYMTSEATVAARITRAKKKLAEAGVPFETPSGDELSARLPSVLSVLYLIFNEGYTATAGDDWMRTDLCEEAMRLGRIVAELSPREPEVHGLVALMELQASRFRARTGAGGEPILLLDQDRGRWDWVLIGRGLKALDRARATDGPIGPYTLQAEIAACHARARTAGQTDWHRIADTYTALNALTRSPVVGLNRAVAIGMAQGPQAGLDAVDALDVRALAGYHLLPGVRGDLLEKLGRHDEAKAEFERAASMTRNQREREVMLSRAAAAGEA